jgi:triosephosphate isomerase (TIM)
MRTPILAGNWKMYKTRAEARELVQALLAGLPADSGREVVVCPPFTALAAVGELLTAGGPIQLGAQNVSAEAQGAFTGEIAPAMLADAGCRYVIVGHSERRTLYGETDAGINRKLHAVLAAGMRPILCVGETKPQRDAGEATAVVTAQLRGGLLGVTAAQYAEVVIAYEPVWAIGTGDTATAADAQAMHAAIRATVAELGGSAAAAGVRIQYGGSVKPENVDELMAQPDIDGALVGGASLQAGSFLRIVQYVAAHS